MARLPYVEPEKRPDLNELAAKISDQRSGHVSHLYAMLLNSPPVCAGWLHFLTACRKDTIIPGSHRELVIVRIALVNDAPYEYKSHSKLALKEGMTQEQLDELPNWEKSKLFDTQMRAVLAYSDAMTRDIKVSDEVFAGVRAIYNDRQVMEMTALIAAYNTVSRFLVALHVGS